MKILKGKNFRNVLLLLMCFLSAVLEKTAMNDNIQYICFLNSVWHTFIILGVWLTIENLLCQIKFNVSKIYCNQEEVSKLLLVKIDEVKLAWFVWHVALVLAFKYYYINKNVPNLNVKQQGQYENVFQS